MPPFRASTYKTIRQYVGLSLGVMQKHTTSSSADSSSVIATTVKGGTNDHLGKWVRISDTDATTANETTREVTAFDGAGDLTTDAFGETIATSIDFELWDEDMDPDTIEDFINRAIDSAVKRGPRKSEYIGVSHRLQRYTIPTGFIGLSKIERRVTADVVNLAMEGRAFDKTIEVLTGSMQRLINMLPRLMRQRTGFRLVVREAILRLSHLLSREMLTVVHR